ncbi:hypothetical protein, partial [Klebsiella pneumoniae]
MFFFNFFGGRGGGVFFGVGAREAGQQPAQVSAAIKRLE